MQQNPIVLLDKTNIFPCQTCSRAFLRQNDLYKHEAKFNHDNLDMLELKAPVFKHLPECEKYSEQNGPTDVSLHVTSRTRDAEIHNRPIIMKSENLKVRVKCETWDIKFEQTKDISLRDCKCKRVQESDLTLKSEPISKKKKQTEDIKFKIKQNHEETFLEHDIKGKIAAKSKAKPESYKNTEYTLLTNPNNPVKRQLTEIKQNNKKSYIQNFDAKFTCGQCPQSFMTLKSMTNHLAKHGDPSSQNYLCSKCPKSFPTVRKRNKHMSVSHSIKHAVYCNICRRECKNSTNLKIHLRTHTGERPFPCKQCGKRFTQTASLYTHMKIHLGLKKHICSYCNKAFTEYSNMKKHERTHTKERPHECKYCGKAFGDPSALLRHHRTHTGDKLYHCQLCDMRFSDASGLIAHKKRHDGKRDFACKHCAKAFFSRTQLLNHQTSQHTTIKNFQCELCKKKFALKQYLKMHIDRQHL